jgi:nicotinamidase-related amidase/alkylated DNA repair dioxygenase AlkB
MVTKMSSLMDLLSQNQPHFQTHQALLVIGLQNDFIEPDGRLPVSTSSGYLERIQKLIPKFRELNGNVIWVQTLYEVDRIANDMSTGEGDALVVGGLIEADESSTEGGEEEHAKDLPPEKRKPSKNKQRALDLLKRVSARRKTIPQEVAQATVEQDDELFLLKSDKKMPACVPDSHGAQFADVIARQFELPADIVIKTTNYSAFQGTSLLMTLRARLVTELYICGCITNVSVLATVIDAARHGVKINVIEDCLGYRKQARHEVALKRMDEFFDAYLVNSTDILARERPVMANNPSTLPNGSRPGLKGSEQQLEDLVGNMSLKDPDARTSSRAQGARSPSKVLAGGPRKLSLASVVESRSARSPTPTSESIPEPADEEFAEKLEQGATVPGAQESGENQETKLVTKKIRMRSKGKKKKKKEDSEAAVDNAESGATNGEPSVSADRGTAEASSLPVATEAPVKAPSPIESPRPAPLAKAESTLNLREKVTRQRSLKGVASQPALSAYIEGREKGVEKESWSDRMRLSFSRAPKSDPAAESKHRGSVVSIKASSTTSKTDSRPSSITAKAERPATPINGSDAKSTLKPSTQTPTEPPTAAKTVTFSSTPSQSNVNMGKPSKLKSLANLPVLGPGDIIAEGDSRIINDFFPPDHKHPTNPLRPLCELIFTQLHNEVRWQKMMHQQGEVPRLVCCQGEFGEDGSMPVYRHPADQTLPLLHFSPKVQVIRRQAEKLAGHPLNHVLIQMYRSGNDYISEHSDKTLDIAKGSSIVNVSFGAQRTMRLRTKKSSKPSDSPESKTDDNERTTQRVAMPHNSMFILGLTSNAKWLHGIMPDKRDAFERNPAETAYNGIRISLTFRHISTFLSADEAQIWGQGATAKHIRDAADVINGEAFSSEKMIRAFSRENHAAEFSWDDNYGAGFDVLHLHTSTSTDLPLLFASNNTIETKQAQLVLAEAKIAYTLIDAPLLEEEYEIDRQVAFRDNDTHHTEVTMSAPILTYIDRFHPFDRDQRAKPCTANGYVVMLLAAGVMKAWMNRGVPTYAEEFRTLMACLEEKLESDGCTGFVAGERFGIADCYVWPLLDEVVERWDGWDRSVYGALWEYYGRVWRKKGCVRGIREVLPEGRRKELGEEGGGKDGEDK